MPAPSPAQNGHLRSLGSRSALGQGLEPDQSIPAQFVDAVDNVPLHSAASRRGARVCHQNDGWYPECFISMWARSHDANPSRCLQPVSPGPNSGFVDVARPRHHSAIRAKHGHIKCGRGLESFGGSDPLYWPVQAGAFASALCGLSSCSRAL